MSLPTDKELIEHRDLRNWLRYPTLPMKRCIDGELQLDFYLHNPQTDDRIFYLGHWKQAENGTPTTMTVDEVLADGWEID